MDKHVKLRLIVRSSLFLHEYIPVTQSTNLPMFVLLRNKFEKFQNWKEVEIISREQFEKHINNNADLVDAYLDEYSKKADFYKCTIHHAELNAEYYLMLVNGELTFLFF